MESELAEILRECETPGALVEFLQRERLTNVELVYDCLKSVDEVEAKIASQLDPPATSLRDVASIRLAWRRCGVESTRRMERRARGVADRSPQATSGTADVRFAPCSMGFVPPHNITSPKPLPASRGGQLGWGAHLAAFSLTTIGTIVATGACFGATALDGQYLRDDEINYVTLPFIHGWSWEHARWWLWRGVVLGRWEPVAMALKASVVQLFGNDVQTWHVVALVSHAAVSMGAAASGRRVLHCLVGEDDQGTPSAGRAASEEGRQCAAAESLGIAFGAVLFACHPLNAQAVLWVSCLPILWAALLAELAVCVTIADSAGWPRVFRHLIAALILAVAGGAKGPAVAAAPFCVLLELARTRSPWLAMKRQGLLVVVAALLVTALVYKERTQGGNTEAIKLDSWELPARASLSFALMLLKALLPLRLAPEHPVPHQGVTTEFKDAFVAAAVIAMGSMAALAFGAMRRGPRGLVSTLLVLALGYLLLVAPGAMVVSGKATWYADRYCYAALALSMPAACAAIASALPRLAALFAPVLLALNAKLARDSARFYVSEPDLWARVVELYPTDHLGLHALGVERKAAGRFQEAEELIRRSLDDFEVPHSHWYLAQMLRDSRDAEATWHLERTLHLVEKGGMRVLRRFELAKVHSTLGVHIAAKGRVYEAYLHFDDASRLSPRNPRVHANAATAAAALSANPDRYLGQGKVCDGCERACANAAREAADLWRGKGLVAQIKALGAACASAAQAGRRLQESEMRRTPGWLWMVADPSDEAHGWLPEQAAQPVSATTEVPGQRPSSTTGADAAVANAAASGDPRPVPAPRGRGKGGGAASSTTPRPRKPPGSGVENAAISTPAPSGATSSQAPRGAPKSAATPLPPTVRREPSKSGAKDIATFTAAVAGADALLRLRKDGVALVAQRWDAGEKRRRRVIRRLRALAAARVAAAQRAYEPYAHRVVSELCFPGEQVKPKMSTLNFTLENRLGEACRCEPTPATGLRQCWLRLSTRFSDVVFRSGRTLEVSVPLEEVGELLDELPLRGLLAEYLGGGAAGRGAGAAIAHVSVVAHGGNAPPRWFLAAWGQGQGGHRSEDEDWDSMPQGPGFVGRPPFGATANTTLAAAWLVLDDGRGNASVERPGDKATGIVPPSALAPAIGVRMQPRSEDGLFHANFVEENLVPGARLESAAIVDFRLQQRVVPGAGSSWLMLRVHYASASTPRPGTSDLVTRRLYGDFPLVSVTAKPQLDDETSAGASAAKRRPHEKRKPYVSFVACGRDDGYSYGFEDRVKNHVDILLHQLSEFAPRLEAEIVAVEWDPPAQSRLASWIREVLRRHAAPRAPLRLLRVTRAAVNSSGVDFERSFSHSHCLNVGIRRARGHFVVGWNFDDVMSPALVRFLASGTLRNDTVYSVGIWFDPVLVPASWLASRKLRVLTERSLVDALHAGEPLEQAVHARPEANAGYLETFDGLCEVGDGDEWAAASTMPGDRYNYFAGDFLFASHNAWAEAKGFFELPFDTACDGVMMCKFWALGLRQAVLLPPCRVIHQHHERRPPASGSRGALMVQEMCDAALRRDAAPPGVPHRPPEDWGYPNAGKALVSEELLR